MSKLDKCHNCGKKGIMPKEGILHTGNWAGDFFMHCSTDCKDNCTKEHE